MKKRHLHWEAQRRASHNGIDGCYIQPHKDHIAQSCDNIFPNESYPECHNDKNALISNNTAMHAQNERQTQRSQACGDTQSGGHLAWADI